MNDSRGLPKIPIGLYVLVVVSIFIFEVLVHHRGGREEVHVVMWNSPAKMTYMADIFLQFNKEQHKLAGTNKTIVIHASAVDSGPISNYLVDKLQNGVDFPEGVKAPQIVSPSSDSWLARVNYLTGQDLFDLHETKSLALTPLVIAMYQDMATCLGWPAREISWSDIIDLAQSPDGWSAYPCAKVEWGKKPLLAWTDPALSSTANSALLETYAFASGKLPAQLTVDDVSDARVQGYIRNLQSAVDHYFPTTIDLESRIFEGPHFVHFVPLEESKLVWLRDGRQAFPNQDKLRGPLSRKMVAIYPQGGSIMHNNPGAVLQNVPWTSPEQQAAARVFIDYLLQPAQQEKAMEWGFRPANSSVPYGDKLTAEYGIDPAQPRTVLDATEPAVMQAIRSKWQEVKKPGVVVIVVDVSGSMLGDKLEAAKKGVTRFVEAMSPQNHIGLITFSDSIKSTVPIGPMAKKRYDVVDSMDSASARGGTALYDAVEQAIRAADAYELPSAAIRGVVILSDGGANSGAYLTDVVNVSRAEVPQERFRGWEQDDLTKFQGVHLAVPTTNNVHVFSIAYGKDAQIDVLRLLAEATDSDVNKADPSNIAKILEVFSKYF